MIGAPEDYNPGSLVHEGHHWCTRAMPFKYHERVYSEYTSDRPAHRSWPVRGAVVDSRWLRQAVMSRCMLCRRQ